MCFGQTTNTSTTSPTAATLANYADVTAQAKQVASTPYQAYGGELVAGLNQGQSDAIGELQSGVGAANPFLNAGSSYLDNASSGLGNVGNYLQAASGLGNISGFTQGAQSALGQAAAYATPTPFSQQGLAAYQSPYTQSVIDSTMANAAQQDAIQQQQLTSGAIGQGAYGGDRAGIAQSALAGQQALANNQTIAGLENQGYSTALGQFNQNQANQYQAANTYGNIGQQQAGLGQLALSNAGLYNTLGQTQGQQAGAYGTLAGLSGNLGQIAQSTSTAGASAALQGSTLQQQNQQAQDTAAYQQFQNAIQYPFQTTSYLANIDQGIGTNSGTLSTSPGASALSQVAGAGIAGLGILGTTGGLGTNGYLTGTTGLFSQISDERVKDDIQPIGKTFDGQTMYRYRYKGDPVVRTGLIAQEVEQRHPHAVQGLGGLKSVEYGRATDAAAERGHFARGGVAAYRSNSLYGLPEPEPEHGWQNSRRAGLGVAAKKVVQPLPWCLAAEG